MSPKRCTKCGSSGPFERDGSKSDGLSCRCKACKKAYRQANVAARSARARSWRSRNRDRDTARQKRWYEENKLALKSGRASYYQDHKAQFVGYAKVFEHARRELVSELKRNPCKDCGRSYAPCCMDFDHVRGSKLASVSQLLTRSEAKLRAEISKCELVCANCHRVRTEARRKPSQNPYRQRLREKLQALKAAPCSDCGQTFASVAMDFDHTRDKTIDVARIWSWTRVLEEVAKCDLVCACCHRLRTQGRRANEVT